MRTLRAALIRMISLFRQQHADKDLTVELETHLQAHIDDNLRAGMTPGEARRHALLKLGGINATTETYRDRDGMPALEHLSSDIRYAVRQLLRSPAFSITTGLTLVLCIAANAVLLSVVYTVLLRPLPIPESDRIVLMSNAYPGSDNEIGLTSGVPDYYDRLRDTTIFEELALFNWGNVSLDQNGAPARVVIMNITPSFFRLVRVPTQMGRTFAEQEGQPGNEKKVILSDGLWHSLFGGTADVVGQEMRLDGQVYTIVGVMPPSFTFIDQDVQLWRPLAFTAEQKSDQARHNNEWWNVGRLKPGATLALAQTQIDALNAANLERFPQWKSVLINARFHTVVEILQDRLVRDVKPMLYLLWGGALFVLLIGWLNVTNLALVRSWARLRELATRMALGAGRWRITRQLVLETVVLAIISAAIGLMLAYGGLRALTAWDLQNLPRRWEIGLTFAVSICILAAAAVIGLVIGLIPALTVLPADVNAALRSGAQSASSHTQRFRQTLVVVQVGFAFVLLIGSGLLLASFRHILAVDAGFTADRVLTASVSLPRARYSTDAALRGFIDRALGALRVLPGVRDAGATDTIPLGSSHSDSVILAEGYQMKPGESFVAPDRVRVTPGYFTSMGVRLTGGRFFDESDGPQTLPVVIIDDALAHRFWPGQNAVGHRLYTPTDVNHLYAVNDKTVFRTIVGVVRNVELYNLAPREQSVGTYYFPYAQQPSPGLISFAVKTTDDPGALSASVRQVLNGVDHELPVFNIRTMREGVNRSLINRRASTLLAASFGVLALFLSAIGIYGVLAYLVTRRTKEIGIRVALGSTRRAILALVLREGFLIVGAGFVMGAAVLAALQRGLESQLFGIRPTDPIVLGIVVLLLTMVALAACLVPARRAVRIDPMVALRSE